MSLSDDLARQEQERQDRINRGMTMLAHRFEGGTYGVGGLTDPSQLQQGTTYYDSLGNPITVKSAADWRTANPGLPAAMTMSYDQLTPQTGGTPFDPGNAVNPIASDQWYIDNLNQRRTGAQPAYDQAAMNEQLTSLLNQGTYGGVETSEGFGPAFYDKAYQAQKDYLTPQVDQQFQDAQRQLMYALARQGLLASSQGSGLNAKLTADRGKAYQTVEDKSLQVKAQQQQAVEDERASLTQLLQQTGDVESAMNMASAAEGRLRTAPPLETLGPMFGNSLGTLADLVVSPAVRAQGYSNSSRVGGYGGMNLRGSGKVVT